MARAKFKCKRCDRKFSMAAHLARHMNTIHARKKRATAARKKTVGKAKARKTARPKTRVRSRAVGRPRTPTSRASVVSSRLLADMQTVHSNLLNQRSSLDSEINGLAQAMKALGGTFRKSSTRSAPSRGRGRKSGFREGSLKSFIVRVLRPITKPLSPQDIGQRVIKAGFKTKSKDITKAVSNTLPQLGGVKRVGFGKYKLSAK